MPQQDMTSFVEELEAIGQLTRIKEPKRVDELPALMEASPNKAILVEKVIDSEFMFLAGAYSTREQYAHALKCDPRDLGKAISRVNLKREKPVLVETAPCKEVILKGKDVDLTRFPLFLYHKYDGHAFIQDTNVVSRDLETGLINWGIYRFMYRSRNETNIDMRNDSHNARIHAKKYQKAGKDMPVAVVIGGPTLDKVASMYSFAGEDDWDILGGFYGEPAKVVKCETNDLTVPANAEIILEGRMMTSEGWIYDEGPYGEYTGTYGSGLPKNCRFVVDCITYRRNAIYQYATIGGLHPGRTDLMIFNPTIESDIYSALKLAGLHVLDVHAPYGGSHNIVYARLKVVGGGDAKQALGLMLTCSRQWFPKLAYVFDEDIDIFDDDQVKWAMAWRYNPQIDTVIIPDLNILPLDPLAQTNHPPVHTPKAGFDCTIPIVGNIDRVSFMKCSVTEPFGVPPANAPTLEEPALEQAMEAYIKEAPRTWEDILRKFHGQPYPNIYRAFGTLRPRLGRVADQRPEYPYTIADSCFVYRQGAKDAAES
ncbi:MAG: UbiD family decarboxylase [Proteobacteria bacterium]|nr:UbiD family decarboxylase [Pseudomonadota bacterium]